MSAIRRQSWLLGIAVLLIGPAAAAVVLLFNAGDAFLFKSLPFREPADLYLLQQRDPKSGKAYETVAAEEARSARAAPVVVGVTAFGPAFENVTVKAAGAAVSLPAASVDEHFLPVLGLNVVPIGAPAFGLVEPGEVVNALITPAAWRRLGGGDDHQPREIQLADGGTGRVVGLLPDGFLFPELGSGREPDILLIRLREDGLSRLFAIARAAPGADPRQVQAAVNVATATAREAFPELSTTDVRAARLDAALFEHYRPVFRAVLAIAALIVFSVATTLALLLVDSAIARSGEYAIRSALGATRWHLSVSVLLEVTALTGAAAIAGLLVAKILAGTFVAQIPGHVYQLLAHDVDVRSLWMTLFLVGVIAVLAFVPPLVCVIRLASTRALTGHLSRTRPTGRITYFTFIGIQMAIAVAVTVSTVRIYTTIWDFTHHRLGIQSDNTFTVALRLPTGPTRLETFMSVLDRIRALSFVDGAGASDGLPLSGLPPGDDVEGSVGEIVVWRATPGYFKAAGVPVIEGREFRTEDKDSHGRAIASATFARRLAGHASLVGRSVTLKTAGQVTVIGVAGNTRPSFEAEDKPVVYLLADRIGIRPPPIVVQTRLSQPALENGLRANFPDLGKDGIAARPIATRLRRLLNVQYFMQSVATFWALIALTLGAVGASLMTRRLLTSMRHDLAIRTALGAPISEGPLRIGRRLILPTISGALVGLLIVWSWDSQLKGWISGLPELTSREVVYGLSLVLFVTAACVLIQLRVMRGTNIVTELQMK